MGKILSAFAVVLLALVPAVVVAAPVIYRPVALQQPDGSTVDLYVSGDEYYHWVHDENGLPVERDADGWIMYVGERGLEPVLSDIPVGAGDPAMMGLDIEPGPPITDDAVRARIDERRSMMAVPRTLTPRFGGPYRGMVNELVVFVRFADEEEFTDDAAVFETMFNADGEGSVSLDSYFNEASYGRLRVEGHFYPRSSAGTVVSFQDTRSRSYYQPHSDRNDEGYYGDQNGMYRLADMLDRAIKDIKPQVPANLDLDLDDDGFAENVVFIVSGNADDWANALWPHSYIMLHDNYINGARLLPYNLQFRDWLLERSVGVLAHEFFHAIGAPDLYRYVNRESTPAGSWDLMEHNAEPPEHMTAWMKYRYGGFIDTVPEISESGRYTLKPLTSPTDNVYQIAVPGQKYQSIIVEYRKKEGTYESAVPGTGLLAYRVDRLVNGNANGPPDELYVLRPGGHPDADGDIDSANMGADVGRTRIDEASDPYPFDQARLPISVRIYDISEAGDTISFSVCTQIPDCIGQECGDDGCGGSCGSCDDHNPCTEDQCLDGACVFIPAMIGTQCDDGEACSEPGICNGQGVCEPGAPVACDDGIECTVDSCVDGGKWVDVGEDRFEDIMADGADAGVDGDNVVSQVIEPGFDLRFSGWWTGKLYAYDNGLIQLGDPSDPLVTADNRSIPMGDPLFTNIVAVYWDDLVCRLADHCVVAYKVLGEAPNRRLIVQWNKVVTAVHPDQRMYFQMAWFEDGRIELRYRDLAINDGLRATVGIETYGPESVAVEDRQALQWSLNARSVRSGMTLAYSPNLSECVARPLPGTCLIGGECVAGGTVSPDNACVECRPLVNLGGWASDDANVCTDANACTRADICRAGACQGTDPVVCKPVNQCYMAGTCDTSTGVCGDPMKDDGTLCNFDSNGCTVGDYCVQGACLVGAPPDCTAKDAECAIGTCVSRNSNSFKCEGKTAGLSGVACGDGGSPCSAQDTCDGKGRCAPNDLGADVVCREAKRECDVPDYCDGAGGCGENELVDDGTVCGYDRSRVCNAGMCVTPASGDICADAVVLAQDEPRRGSVAYADATAGQGADCLTGTGADVYYRVHFTAGVGYELSVSARDGRGDFAFAVLETCGGDVCAALENKGGAGTGETRELAFEVDTDAYVRVVKMDQSDDVDFVISLATADRGSDDLVGLDATDQDVMVADESGGGEGCAQNRAGSSASPFAFAILLVGFFWAMRAAARSGRRA